MAGSKEPQSPKEVTQPAKPKCGIIMPISEMPGYTASHWADVQRLIKGAAKAAGFDSEMVSTSVDIGVLHANIINNIYENEMVVCDVSGKNPNVMFELGLRLASKRPVIIIKDDATSYSFDTSPIEHLEYRRDLRLYETVEFQQRLARKITDTLAASNKPGYKTFLDHFGNYNLASVEDKTVDLGSFVREIYARLTSIEQSQAATRGEVSISSRSKSEPLDHFRLIERWRKTVQHYVNEHLKDSPVTRMDEFAMTVNDMEEYLVGHYAQDIDSDGISRKDFREAIEMAVEEAIRLNPPPSRTR